MKDFLISFILESIVNIGEIFLFYLLLNHKFQLKKADVSSRLKLFSFLLLQVLILSTFNCTSTSMIVILAFLLGTDILFALFVFECSLMQSILWSGIYAIIGLLPIMPVFFCLVPLQESMQMLPCLAEVCMFRSLFTSDHSCSYHFDPDPSEYKDAFFYRTATVCLCPAVGFWYFCSLLSFEHCFALYCRNFGEKI